MRWDALFADLEAQADAEAEADLRSEAADRVRVELGRLRLIDRLQPGLGTGARLRIGLIDHAAAEGALLGLGIDWLLLRQESGVEWLVPLASVQLLQGLSSHSAEPGWEGRVGARLDLRVALRRVVRDRSPVAVGLRGGQTVRGRLAWVGADHLELTEAEARRGEGPGWTIPLSSVVFVQRR